MEITRTELQDMLKQAVHQALNEQKGPDMKGVYGPGEPQDTPGKSMADMVRGLVFRDRPSAKTLVSGDTPFLPAGVAAEVIKAAEKAASVRPGATIHPVAESTGRVPIARPSTTAYWVGEDTEPPSETEPAFTYLAWNVSKLKAYTKVTVEALEDNAPDIGAEIIECLGRAIRHTEESAFWMGDGVGKPTGIDTSIPSAWVMDGTGISVVDALNAAYMKLPPEFRERAAWFANSTTKATLLGLKDLSDRPLLVPSLSEASVWTVYGRPVHEVSLLPDNTIYIGDMSFYHIFDRKQMEIRVITEDENLALADEVLITITQRTDGKLVWDDDGGITPFVKLINLGQ